MKSENKNFLYNVAYQIIIYLFPLATVPYISRVLGVDNIGIYSYTYSIVNCLMLFAMLGISNYGNREISKLRDDKEKMSKMFFSIYGLQLISSLIILIIYTIFILFFCKSYKDIFVLQYINLISVCFDVSWFFFGLEKFKMTINRNIIIKFISLICIFLFVKTKNDLWIYTVIMGLGVLISQLYLILKLKDYVSLQRVNLKDIFGHLKKCLILFIPVLAYSIYRIMDKTMIGYFSSVTELGYYENAEKIINIPISIITALGTVMLPRMSYILNKNKEKYKSQILESMKLALILSVTMALGLILIGKDAAIILFGSEYLKSGNIIMILAITIIASAWSNVVRTQYLIPTNEDKIYVYSTLYGAILNFLINIILIKKMGAYGACVGTIFAEFFVMIYQTVATRKELEVRKYLRILLECITKGILIIAIAYMCSYIISNIYIKVSVQIVISIVVFIILNFNFIVKDFFNIKKRI